MVELPGAVTDATTLPEAAAALGDLLGLEKSAPLDATQRALDDRLYARALLSARNIPQLRQQLLMAPDTINIAPAAGEKRPATTSSNLKLAAKAAAAALKWGAEGLKHAEPWVIERRLAACNSCEFQADAPDTLMYRGVKVAVGKDAKICTQCECLTNTKAALATEHCPEKSTENPDLSRWQEPWLDTDKLSKWPWR